MTTSTIITAAIALTIQADARFEVNKEQQHFIIPPVLKMQVPPASTAKNNNKLSQSIFNGFVVNNTANALTDTTRNTNICNTN